MNRQSGLQKTLRAFKKLTAGDAAHSPPLGDEVVRHGTWACDACLQGNRAVAANPARQKFCCCLPRLAYIDRELTCSACRKDFVFRARDQQAWYEVYGIWTFVEPRNCLTCRRKIRSRKSADGRIGDALRSLDPKSSPQLAGVATLYVQAGHFKKAAEFFRRARNRAKSPEDLDALTKRLAELSAAEGEAR
jgi:hypothetical protein